MTQAGTLQDRLAHEARYFDEHYRAEAARGIQPISDADKRRYLNPPANTIFPREYFYHLLAPLAGKHTLEIACGNGIDASICACNGAVVHAYDLSAASIEMTRMRAKATGVASRVNLEVTGDVSQAFAGQTFDVVLGYAALHHLPLEGLSQRIYDRLKPGGVAVFAEPVVNSKLLHALRRCIPYSIHGETEDEVPFNDQIIAEFTKPFDRIVRREFQCTSRIWPMFPESIKWHVSDALHKLDSHLMKLSMLRRFATVTVFALYRDR